MLSAIVLLFAANAIAIAPPRAPRMTFSLDLRPAFMGYFEVASELRIAGRFSLALHAGVGSRLINAGPNHGTTIAWETGLEPRAYLDFPTSSLSAGAYVAW